MRYIYKYTSELIVLIYFFLFLGFRDVDRPWDRVINSDGKGYYAYLPALFIYHDLQFKFVEGYEYQYYPGNRSVFKEFRTPSGEKVVNKYFPGMAIVWLPFFLLGHMMAWLEVFPRDGYSQPYQYAIALSAFFFLWIGIKSLQRLLKKFNANDRTASFLTFIIALGTNLLFFTIIEGSMTHVYSFALITGFLVTTYNLFHQYKSRWLFLSLFLLSLIVLIRPTNALVILLVPFLAGGFKRITESLRDLTKHPIAIGFALGFSLLILISPFILWKLQTGHWIVYTYGSEKLNLLHPQILNILFSYNRGWFLYTPVAFVSFFGLIRMLRESRFRFFWMSLFLLSFVYLVSCWWVWFYASKCGQRVFIDIYAAVALLLLFLYRSWDSVTWKRFLTGVLLLLVALNGLQFYQHCKWIFPPSTITRPVYWDAVVSFHQKARVYLPGKGILSSTALSNDLETEKGWMNESTRTNELAYSGTWSSLTNKKNPYSLGIEINMDTLFSSTNRIVKVTTMLYVPREKTEATLVTDFQYQEKSLSYNPFYLEKFIQPDRWEKIEAAFYVPADLPSGTKVKVYLYNPSGYRPIFMDDLRVEFISLATSSEYLKIEGVIMPNR